MSLDGPRSGCVGPTPLTARLADWQLALCLRPELLSTWIEDHGSPINLIDPSPMEANAADLRGAARRFGLELRVFFARKANKSLALVDEAKRLGLGVDVAGERELEQALARGLDSREVVMTAAIKPESLLESCLSTETTVVIDNEDELRKVSDLAHERGVVAPIAIRLAPEIPDARTPTRFGLGSEEATRLLDSPAAGSGSQLRIEGVHFHLDGYSADDRVTAIGEAVDLIDTLRACGHEPRFLDIGGGIPMSYIDSAGEWSKFWAEHRMALTGKRPPLTYEGHGLGLSVDNGEVVGEPNVYPYHQELIRGPWLARVLAGTIATRSGRSTVAKAINDRGLELRCEPGRSLLDGCGMTVARVEFRKQRADGAWLIGLGMNRTQCRSTSDDFLVDPLLIPARPEPGPTATADERTPPIEAYLVGAYCIERELLTWRRLRFPRGVGVGDLVVFPNTAGYLMHILESSSHQIPLARNLIVTGGSVELDPIDRADPSTSRIVAGRAAAVTTCGRPETGSTASRTRASRSATRWSR